MQLPPNKPETSHQCNSGLAAPLTAPSGRGSLTQNVPFSCWLRKLSAQQGMETTEHSVIAKLRPLICYPPSFNTGTHKLARGSPTQTNESKLNQPYTTKICAQQTSLYCMAAHLGAAQGRVFPPTPVMFLYFNFYTTSL